MTDDLVKRLRDGCLCNIDSTPCMAEEECRDAYTAADRIEELQAKLAQQDDLVQAAVAAALREAAGIASYHQDWGDVQSAILTLITPDAQAALDRVVAAALREAAQAARLSISERDEWPPKDGDVLVDDCMAAILALITPDSQAALDRVVWAERERCAKVSENFGCCHVPQEIAAAIREGGE